MRTWIGSGVVIEVDEGALLPVVQTLLQVVMEG
jgi:hypothetical protein